MRVSLDLDIELVVPRSTMLVFLQRVAAWQPLQLIRIEAGFSGVCGSMLEGKGNGPASLHPSFEHLGFEGYPEVSWSGRH